MPEAAIQTTVRVKQWLYERAQAAAKKTGMSLNEWINRALQEKAEREAPREPFVEGRPANWESLSEDESPPVGMSWPEWARRRAERGG